MQEINPIRHAPAASLTRTDKIGSYKAAAQSTTRPSDRVELSDVAQILSRLAQIPDVRQDVVDRVRKAIADGTYETDDKLDATAQNLLEDLRDLDL